MKIEEFAKVIARGLEIDESRVTPETKASEIPEWDSLGHLSIITYLNDTYDNISQDIPDLGGATSVREFYDLLSGKLP